jgi:hypothetical protein
VYEFDGGKDGIHADAGDAGGTKTITFD